MGGRWGLSGFQLHWLFIVVLIFHLKLEACLSLNLEGLALLQFRATLTADPNGALSNWSSEDDDPCLWHGVSCLDGKVGMLNLSEHALEGVLTPDLGKLSQLRALILYKNKFSGVIPKEIGELTQLELLDLRYNDFTGEIPAELANMVSLKYLLLCNNSFDSIRPSEFQKFDFLLEPVDHNFIAETKSLLGYTHRKIGMRKGISNEHEEMHFQRKSISSEQNVAGGVQHFLGSARRKLLEEASNVAASNERTVPSPADFTPRSGSLDATPPPKSPDPNSPSPAPFGKDLYPPGSMSNPLEGKNQTSAKKWNYIFLIPGAAVILVVTLMFLLMFRGRGASTIGPWKTGLSGQLQKAFVAGVPKLNRPELETACEDFSNIVETLPDCTVFKGTLSSGVEIAVVSPLASSKEWSKHFEMYFRKKIDTLSRLNHKNFANLLGYCIEDEPFSRMMVFEYAPNGTLYEHLHVKEIEHLDWNARMRIIMGMAYCLHYMHHELNPPIAHPDLHSTSVYLTDDFAAKLADFGFGEKTIERMKTLGSDELDHGDWPYADLSGNIYNFGILLLEIISGKLPYSEEQGHLVNWAIDYLNDKRSISYMIDPTLKSFKNNELDIICEVIQQCIHPDTKQRPTMKEITTKLREVIPICPDAATPKLSPLWWAELEILSVEAS